MSLVLQVDFLAHADFIEGLQLEFNPSMLPMPLLKLFICYVVGHHPLLSRLFYAGGALGVGKASTTSFVWTSVAIIVMNSFVTNLLLT